MSFWPRWSVFPFVSSDSIHTARENPFCPHDTIWSHRAFVPIDQSMTHAAQVLQTAVSDLTDQTTSGSLRLLCSPSLVPLLDRAVSSLLHQYAIVQYMPVVLRRTMPIIQSHRTLVVSSPLLLHVFFCKTGVVFRRTGMWFPCSVFRERA